MKFPPTNLARIGLVLLSLTLVASCGLPRGGPTKKEIFAGSVQEQGDAFVVSVNRRVTTATSVYEALGFSSSFVDVGVVGADTINPGDTLGLTIYENVEDGLLVAQGAPATALDEVQVDGAGFIFVPYAGRIRAAGNSTEAVRRIIADRLGSQTPDPQVLVRRLSGDGSSVSVAGGVGSQGIYPIERPTRRLSAMLTRAGGVAIEPEIALVTVSRAGKKERIWFEDLYKNPSFDIALRDGDRILVEEDDRSFTALGATGAQQLIPFKKQALSAMEAVALVGGLSSALADPTGVFVLRNEPETIANNVLARSDLIGPQRMVYVLDLTEPNGLFEARDFAIRDGDTIYVTEAPYVQWRKILSALTGTAGAANSLNATVN